MKAKSTTLVRRPVLSPDELAMLLGISSATIRRYLRAGRIPGAFQIGSRWFIPRESLPAELTLPEEEERDAQ